jgi:hypothetical protein
MRGIFRDSGTQAHFDQNGYVCEDFLDPDKIDRLRALYFSTAGKGRETYGFAAPLSYYISVFDKDPEHRRAANDGIRELFVESIERLMIDYRILYCNFMVKEPQGGEIQAHQDFTFVDESRFVAFNLWVPLQDTHLKNGCFHLVPGSNRLLQSYRSSTVPDTLAAHNEALKPFMIPLPLAAGRGILFDQKLFHYSPDNESQVPRVAVQLVVIPREAQPLIAYYDRQSPESVRLLAITDDAYLTNCNLWETPSGLPLIETRPYSKLPDRAALVEMLRRHRSADRRDSSPALQAGGSGRS